MTDRALLAAAAKAAQIDITWDYPDKPSFPPRHTGATGNSPRVWWNPLEEDGDAFRLASQLKIDVHFHEAGAMVYTQDGVCYDVNNRLDDPCAGARLATTRAAAKE